MAYKFLVLCLPADNNRGRQLNRIAIINLINIIVVVIRFPPPYPELFNIILPTLC